ncbi:L-2-hydroxyglutarate oxidase [Alteromonas facilis]|uniref:L-2-hydroxyglutarate oxidase n=1 Tax=Alteromonas facilis TaxID=2048004 RepID=UPI0013DBFF35|nr:L-2-hydroxyglutarate oxidase [Alteromonas facilis]
MQSDFDLIIAGAGIVGAATAYEYALRYPQKRIAVLESEDAPAQHQTGRNSGVIHAGVYYPQGSMKAKLCRQGLEQTIGFCQQHDIPFRQCGKLIVATDADEESRLETLFDSCVQNDLTPEFCNSAKIREMEPAIKGRQAVWVSHSGITDYASITRTLLSLAQQQGVQVFYNSGVVGVEETGDNVSLTTHTNAQTWSTQQFVNCAGIHADDLIAKSGLKTDFKLLPFRGEYFRLHERHNQLVERLIYPVPDPTMPFLGIHLTPMIGGYLTVGPNAVLAPGKHAYQNEQWDMSDCIAMAGYSGTWKLLKRFIRPGLAEFRDSLMTSGYLKRVQRYCEHIQMQDLLPYRAGIRAQAVDSNGNMAHDFIFVETDRCLHVGNAPSPAATSALPIAKTIVDKL